MALTLPADAGAAMAAVLVADREVRSYTFPMRTRQVSLRNTGTNTLWVSLDREVWFDVACGTSWDDRVSLGELWCCTQLGRTRFALIGIAMFDP